MKYGVVLISKQAHEQIQQEYSSQITLVFIKCYIIIITNFNQHIIFHTFGEQVITSLRIIDYASE